MSKVRSFSTKAIVLKRKSLAESDRLVTLLTEKRGKITCVAKGVRKIKSSKRAYLEPGNTIQAFLIVTKSLPLLTQARLVRELSQAKSNLKQIRQLSQILEIIDTLFVEEEIETHLFQDIEQIFGILNGNTISVKLIRSKLEKILEKLGYSNQEFNQRITQKMKTSYSVSQLVEQIAEKPMKSWEYLRVKKQS